MSKVTVPDKPQAEKPNDPEKKARKPRVSQQDVPGFALEQAIRIPRALAEHYAYQPTTPLRLAAALGVQPGASQFRMLCGAAQAYGLILGGAFANEIALDVLGQRIVRPLSEGDDLSAKREALLRPKVVGDFLRRYNGAQLPRTDIARNVLEDMGVPHDRTEEVLNLIVSGATSVGFVRSIKDKQYIDLSATLDHEPTKASAIFSPEVTPSAGIPEFFASPENSEFPTAASVGTTPPVNSRRVFVTHGKNKEFIEPIKRLLAFGELEAVVCADKQTVSQPVPDKVMDDMRSCGAAIIHIDAETKLLDSEANEHVVLNPNVLIEIGAAMALYGRRFILLVREGVKLPSNLQGLYEVRYEDERLDGSTTIRLLEAIQHLKQWNPPS